MFDGPEDYHARIDDPALDIDERTILFMRGAGPIGYPGGAEVVNMRPPAYLIRAGVHSLPCIGDGRQSGTSGSPSILNASPEAAAGGGLALLKTGDRVRIDLRRARDLLLSEAEMRGAARGAEAAGGYAYPASQTPWQEMQRGMVGQMDRHVSSRPPNISASPGPRAWRATITEIRNPSGGAPMLRHRFLTGMAAMAAGAV